MSRRRYISTDISTDIKLAELAEHGTLPMLLYTWAIPHLDDWGRMSGEAREFRLLVCPALEVTAKEVHEALNQIASVGLWNRYEVDGKLYIAIPEESWFKHQSYINKSKRDADSSRFPAPPEGEATNAEEHRTSPQITEEQQQTPQNTASFSLSPSLSKKHIVDSGECDNSFSRFWSAYPKKVGKAAALKKWRSLFKQGKIDIDFILERVQEYIAHIDMVRQGGFKREYMDGSTFVNQERWNDDWGEQKPATSRDPTGPYVPSVDESRRFLAEQERLEKEFREGRHGRINTA